MEAVIVCDCGEMRRNEWERQWACPLGRCAPVTDQLAASKQIGPYAPAPPPQYPTPTFYTQSPAGALEYVRPDLFREHRTSTDRETEAIARAAAVILGEGAGAREVAVELLAATRRR